MKKAVLEKMRNCKALQGMTVEELIDSDRFLENLTKYMEAQKADREAVQRSYEAMRKLGGVKGYKLPAHPIDKVIGLSPKEFAAEYKAIIAKRSTRPFAERQYIKQLATQAYAVTAEQIVCEEFPELQKEFEKPTQKN